MYGQVSVNKVLLKFAFMDAPLYCEKTLIPLIQEKYLYINSCKKMTPSTHPELLGPFFKKKISESPDMNPIENLWYELKEFINLFDVKSSQRQKKNRLKEFRSFGT